LSPARDSKEAVSGIEEELREARERYRDLLDALPHHIFSVDNDDRYTALNAHACAYFGLPEHEIVGHTAEELGVPADVARPWHEINARTRQTGITQTYDLVIPGAEPRFERVITQPLRNARGEIIGVTGIAIDVTDDQHSAQAQRRLDEQMAYFSRMESLATLAGGIAHDFNNILTSILAQATILERHTEPALQRNIGSIKQAVDRGAAISRQILAFANAEVLTGTVDVAKLVRDLYTLVAETFPRTVRVQLARDAELPPISGNAGQLHQALLNLCLNARDAMPDGGVLSIDTRLAADRVTICVSDTGVGLDEETRHRMYEPFFSTKEKAKGTGLGLAVVYGIVRAHLGKIEVDSAPGCGTTFRLSFPVAEATHAPVVEEHAEGAIVPGQRLLIIDDEPEILAGLEMQLSEAGYVVQTASDGPDALEHFGEAPDLVLMDLGMPRMRAVELIDALYAVAPNVRIVAMTGYVDPDVHAAVRGAGVTNILQKPFGRAALLAALGAAVRRPAL
jgi:two-component system cell cycle sensor histidine kinase/response regulator CckA